MLQDIEMQDSCSKPVQRAAVKTSVNLSNLVAEVLLVLCERRDHFSAQHVIDIVSGDKFFTHMSLLMINETTSAMDMLFVHMMLTLPCCLYR